MSQYERRERHRERVEELLAGGHAYPDPAVAEDVRSWKQAHGGAGYRGEPRDEPGAAIRLRVPDEGVTVVEDLIRGPVRFENRTQDDFVIARGDGTPLYNLAVAVDDADMGITDVVRGDDHLSNTPKQLLVLGALDAVAAAVCAPAAPARARRAQAVEASWRRLGAGVARPRLPAGRGPQLSRSARLGRRGRRDDSQHRRADRALLDRAGGTLLGDLRRAQAALAERALHARAAAGLLRAATGRSSATPGRTGRGGLRCRGTRATEGRMRDRPRQGADARRGVALDPVPLRGAARRRGCLGAGDDPRGTLRARQTPSRPCARRTASTRPRSRRR